MKTEAILLKEYDEWLELQDQIEQYTEKEINEIYELMMGGNNNEIK